MRWTSILAESRAVNQPESERRTSARSQRPSSRCSRLRRPSRNPARVTGPTDNRRRFRSRGDRFATEHADVTAIEVTETLASPANRRCVLAARADDVRRRTRHRRSRRTISSFATRPATFRSRSEDEPAHPGGFPNFRHWRAERPVRGAVTITLSLARAATARWRTAVRHSRRSRRRERRGLRLSRPARGSACRAITRALGSQRSCRGFDRGHDVWRRRLRSRRRTRRPDAGLDHGRSARTCSADRAARADSVQRGSARPRSTRPPRWSGRHGCTRTSAKHIST